MSGPIQNHPGPQQNDNCDNCYKNGAYEDEINLESSHPTITAQPVQNDGQTVIVVQQQKVEFGPESMMANCPQCQCPVQTRIEHECGLCAILVCVVLFGVFTYFCNCFKDVVHSCPNCGAMLGKYKRGCGD